MEGWHIKVKMLVRARGEVTHIQRGERMKEDNVKKDEKIK